MVFDERDQRIRISLAQPDVGVQHRQVRLARPPGDAAVAEPELGRDRRGRDRRSCRQPPPTEGHTCQHSSGHSREHEDMCQSRSDRHRLPTSVEQVRDDPRDRYDEQ